VAVQSSRAGLGSLGIDTGGGAPCALPSASAVESLAASGPTKVVGLEKSLKMDDNLAHRLWGPAAYREAIDGDGDRNDFRGRGQPFDFSSVIRRREKLALHRCWFLGYQRGMDAKQLHQDVRSGKLGVDDLLDVISEHAKTNAEHAKTNEKLQG
jgi:hypothetical protein